MKIIAIGRNYAEHAKELNNPVPGVTGYFYEAGYCAVERK